MRLCQNSIGNLPCSLVRAKAQKGWLQYEQEHPENHGRWSRVSHALRHIAGRARHPQQSYNQKSARASAGTRASRRTTQSRACTPLPASRRAVKACAASNTGSATFCAASIAKTPSRQPSNRYGQLAYIRRGRVRRNRRRADRRRQLIRTGNNSDALTFCRKRGQWMLRRKRTNRTLQRSPLLRNKEAAHVDVFRRKVVGEKPLAVEPEARQPDPVRRQQDVPHRRLILLNIHHCTPICENGFAPLVYPASLALCAASLLCAMRRGGEARMRKEQRTATAMRSGYAPPTAQVRQWLWPCRRRGRRLVTPPKAPT